MGPLRRIPDPDDVPTDVVELLRSIPGSETLVFTASASAGPDGTGSPFAEALLAAWGPERAVLAELFLFGLAVDGAGVPAGDALAACGLAHDVGGGRLASDFRVVPLLGSVFVADAPAGDPDVCLPPSPTTLELARVVPSTPGRLLDVGCGTGALAVAAALGGAATVVATDISRAPAALTRLNAAIAGVTVDVRHGDLLEPVAGERFDVVVSQPPFLPLPPSLPRFGHLHGGPVGDEIGRAVLAGVDAVLGDGGVAVVRGDRPAAAPPYPGIEVSWPGPAPEDLAAVYAAVHVPVDGPEREEVRVAYQAWLPPLRGTFVVAGTDRDHRAVEVDQPPRSWPALLATAGLSP